MGSCGSPEMRDVLRQCNASIACQSNAMVCFVARNGVDTGGHRAWVDARYFGVMPTHAGGGAPSFAP